MKDRTACAGIMVARGSHGAPWLFRQARAALDGRPVPGEPTPRARFEICVRHTENAVAFEGNQEKAVRDFRKHLGWYTKGLPGGRRLRQELFRATSLGEVASALNGYLRTDGVGALHVDGTPRISDAVHRTRGMPDQAELN